MTNIPNIRVGHFTHNEYATGCTVVICDKGATCGVDIRGGAPGTRETALLAPHCLVEKVNAILLTGGSALGLAAADGVMKYCQEQDYGFGMGAKKIPIVPTAVIYDFNVGVGDYAPTAKDGYEACLSASTAKVVQGNVGAGTGALVGKVCGIDRAMRGGLGTASLSFQNGLIINVLVVVNTFGDVRSYEDNRIIAGARTTEGGFVDTIKYIINEGFPKTYCRSNTIIGIAATNARFDKMELTQIAQMAQVGVSQVITPVHTMYDGDTFFALATGEIEADVNLVGIATGELVKKAIESAIIKSTQK
ncbi:MAG: P1 family peptidase [Thiomargarita sp.]|nr:P1 family peptidase [Thiomargarita sp.]